MMLYGTGVYTAGLFSVRPPRRSRPDVHRPGRGRAVVFPGIRRGLGGIVVRFAAHRFWDLHNPETAADGGRMSEPVKPDDIDAVIHERVRLAIVSALAVSPQLSFNELKSMLQLTDGNLSAHSRTLEDAGYIVVEKSFRGRRPYTAMRLTPRAARHSSATCKRCGRSSARETRRKGTRREQNGPTVFFLPVYFVTQRALYLRSRVGQAERRPTDLRT